MRILFLSEIPSILLCIALWFVIQAGGAALCSMLPARIFHPQACPFRPFAFEDGGRIYDRLFKVKRWKHLLPDGGAMTKNGYAKRRLSDRSMTNLERFLIESCRGELTHWIPIFFFWVFGFFVPPFALWIMLIYALAANLPCILVQRYNRPRIMRVLGRSPLAEGSAESQTKPPC